MNCVGLIWLILDDQALMYGDDGLPKCELAQFDLVPASAPGKKKFGVKTNNARSETVQ